jgi:hypothetical protein
MLMHQWFNTEVLIRVYLGKATHREAWSEVTAHDMKVILLQWPVGSSFRILAVYWLFVLKNR